MQRGWLMITTAVGTGKRCKTYEGSMRIFLIDDDELIISMLSRALKSEGTISPTSARDMVSEVKSGTGSRPA
jgi:hypothetical protein